MSKKFTAVFKRMSQLVNLEEFNSASFRHVIMLDRNSFVPCAYKYDFLTFVSNLK